MSTRSIRDKLRADFFGLADQALISATSLVTMVLLARSLRPAEFGTFTLAYTGLLLANSMQTAFVTSPHNVIGSTKESDRYVVFTSTIAAAQLASAGCVALAVLVVGIVIGFFGIGSAALFAALAAALFCWQLQEFLRRVLYTEGKISGAFINDLYSYAGQSLAIAVLWRTSFLTATTALLAIAVSSAVGVAIGLFQLKRSLRLHIDRAVFFEQWDFGKWLAAGETGYWLSSTIYTYIAAALLGTAASGGLKAAQVILGPLNILLFYLDVMLPIRFSKAWTNGTEQALPRAVRTAYLTTMPFVVGYCVLAGAFAPSLLRIAYGSDYTHFATVVIIVAATCLLSYLGRVLTAALQARRMTQAVFHTHLAAAIFTVALGWLFVEKLGVAGAALGIGLSSLIRCILLLRAYRGAPATRAGLTGAPIEAFGRANTAEVSR
jgi:O-antigen/teichoic acid export membrane protein